MEQFLRLFDVAITEASKMHEELQKSGAPQGVLNAAALTLRNLRGYRQSAVDGKLSRPSGGVGLGMSRAVGEWAEGTPLMDAVRALERYYRTKM